MSTGELDRTSIQMPVAGILASIITVGAIILIVTVYGFRSEAEALKLFIGSLLYLLLQLIIALARGFYSPSFWALFIKCLSLYKGGSRMFEKGVPNYRAAEGGEVETPMAPSAEGNGQGVSLSPADGESEGAS